MIGLVTSNSTRPNVATRRPQWHRLAGGLLLGAIAALGSAAVHAQNLDQGKSAMRLFADNCASCHRSARGLAKGRFRLSLYLFLQNHYATNASSAWALASYLESVEGPQRRPARARSAPPPPARSPASRFSLRPPMPVPNR
jgi:mono/diheme cytochrome c family protein